MKTHLRQLAKLLPEGYSLGSSDSRGPHRHSIIKPDGQVLRDADGLRIVVPDTPSNNRWLLNTISRVKQAVKEESHGTHQA